MTRSGEAQPGAAEEDGANPVASSGRQGEQVLRTPQRAVPSRGGGSGDGRQMEQRGRGLHLAVGPGESSGSAILHDAPNGIGVGAPLDEDAEHSVRRVLRGVVGGAVVRRRVHH